MKKCEDKNTKTDGRELTNQGLWTARESAVFCGFQSSVTILRAFRRGDLSGFKLGPRVVRFDPADVRSWIQNARVEN